MLPKKSIYLLFALGTLNAGAQTATDTTFWKLGGINSLTFSQVSLANWAAGGQNSTALNYNFGILADYSQGRAKWENSLDIAYGLIKQGTTDFAKSDDKINFITKYGFKINRTNEKWFVNILFDFKTQFDEGFDPENESILISDFMAPGYLVIGSGIDYYPNKYLTFSYMPVTWKFTFVTIQKLADQGAYGVDPATFDNVGNKLTDGKQFRVEYGSFFRAKYLQGNFESRLELFTDYPDSFGNIDVNWQNSLIVNFTKVLSTNIFTQLLYDDDIKIGADDNGDGIVDVNTEIKPRVQFKSVVGVGLTYRFGAKKGEE